MVEIKSELQTVDRGAQEVFEYLTVPENYGILMPDKVRSFEATETSATIDIEGLGKVDLAFTEKQPNEFIEMKPQNKVPFDFNLQWFIKEEEEGKSEVYAIINAKLNFMMRMMSEKMLKNFLDVQVDKLAQHLSLNA